MSHINERIKMMSSAKDSIKLFNIINELNKITLNSNGKLNNDFLEELSFCSNDEEVCWEIRDNLISKIDNNLINSENQIKDIMENIIWEKIEKTLMKKKCYYLGEDMHIDAVLNTEELVNFTESLNSFKKHIILDTLNIFNINHDFFKIKMDFKVVNDNYDVFSTTLRRYHFDKILLNHET